MKRRRTYRSRGRVDQFFDQNHTDTFESIMADSAFAPFCPDDPTEDMMAKRDPALSFLASIPPHMRRP